MIEGYFVVTTALAATLFIVRVRWATSLVLGAFAALQCALVAYEYTRLGLAPEGYFKADAGGWLLLAATSAVSVLSLFHAYHYNVSRREPAYVVAMHNAAITMFVAMMSGAILARHLGVMWAFLEATTIFGSVLIYHKRDPTALEAAWKYSFVCSVGVAIAFLGILCLTAAVPDRHVELFTDELARNARKFDPMWLKIAFIFAFTGFSVKMGVVPLFNVDIDAKDVAPSPVGALLSGGLMNAGFIAVFRFYQIFAAADKGAWMSAVLLFAGMVSVFLALVFLMKIQNLKRILAYSSMEHGGIALIALSIGALPAAFMHLFFHSLIKAALFFQIGQVGRIFHTKDTRAMRGYMHVFPAGAVALLIGCAMILGMPPGGLFFSELMTFKALTSRGNYAVLVLLSAMLTLILFAMGRRIMAVIYSPPGASAPAPLRNAETISQFGLAAAAAILAVAPPDELTRLFEQTALLVGP
jgi:hydrogenase-4 component F